jgi:hypothetical protein
VVLEKPEFLSKKEDDFWPSKSKKRAITGTKKEYSPLFLIDKENRLLLIGKTRDGSFKVKARLD